VSITDPAGSALAESAFSNPYLISGSIYLPSLGFHNFGARWYAPNLGRFVSPDPLGFIDGPNRYAFAGNQPLLYFDPNGLWKRQLVDGLVDTGEGLLDFGSGFLDSLLVPPGGLPMGARFGNDLEYAVGSVAGSGIGLFWDSWLIAGGATLAVGGGAVEVVSVGTASPIALPAAGVGVAVAGAGVVGVGVHGGRLVEGFKGLDRAFSEMSSDGPSSSATPEPRNETSVVGGERGVFSVGPYRPSSSPLENHHGVLDIWASHNIPGYCPASAES
jgi:RHS repeat-associated protein